MVPSRARHSPCTPQAVLLSVPGGGGGPGGPGGEGGGQGGNPPWALGWAGGQGGERRERGSQGIIPSPSTTPVPALDRVVPIPEDCHDILGRGHFVSEKSVPLKGPWPRPIPWDLGESGPHTKSHPDGEA